jgi:hypothetical protein
LVPNHGAIFTYKATPKTVSKARYMVGSIILGIGGAKLNNKWWHYAADFTISFAISAAAKSAGMYYIRK